MQKIHTTETDTLSPFEFTKRLAVSLWRKGDYEDVRKVVADAMGNAAQLSADEQLALHTVLAMAERSAGNYDGALKAHQAGLLVLDFCRDEVLILKFRNGLAITYWGLKRFDEAFEQYTAVSVAAEAVGDTRAYAEAQNNIGNLMVDAGNPSGSHEYIDRALRACDSPAERAQVYDTRARAYHAEGRTEDARRAACMSLELTLAADEERLIYEHLATFFEVGGLRVDIDKLKHALEARDIRKALSEANGSVYRAAVALGLTCEGLRWKLEHQHRDLIPLRKPKRRSPVAKK